MKDYQPLWGIAPYYHSEETLMAVFQNYKLLLGNKDIVTAIHKETKKKYYVFINKKDNTLVLFPLLGEWFDDIQSIDTDNPIYLNRIFGQESNIPWSEIEGLINNGKSWPPKLTHP